jgi:site-specific DNA-methyltransferase (adenine-specific)
MTNELTPYASGDGWTLYKADALHVLERLQTDSVSALITDPPYSSGGMVRGDRMSSTKTKYVQSKSSSQELDDFTGDTRDQRSYAYWCALWLGECLRAVKTGGSGVLFSDWRQLPATTDAFQSGGWVWRGIVPWVKTTYRPQAGRFAAQCEYAVWGSSGPMGIDYSLPSLPGFYEEASPRQREHITQKPLGVMRNLCKIVDVGETILDPFAGSGTTGVAALLEGRQFIGVEMTDHYAKIAARRLNEASGLYVAKNGQEVLNFGDDVNIGSDGRDD